MACRTLNYKLVHQYDLSNVNMYNIIYRYRYRLWSLLARCNHSQGLQRGLTRAQDQARAASCRGQHLRGTAWCATVESLVATQPRTYVDYSGTPGAPRAPAEPVASPRHASACEVTEQHGAPQLTARPLRPRTPARRTRPCSASASPRQRRRPRSCVQAGTGWARGRRAAWGESRHQKSAT